MSTPAGPVPPTLGAPPNPPMATRFPSMRTRVSFGSKPRRFGMTAPSPPTVDVLVDSRAHLLRQIGQQVRCIADAQFFDVSRTIRVHWIWSDLFCGGNVRASDDDTFHFGNTSGRRRWFPEHIMPEGSSKPIVAIAHPTHQVNGRLMTSSSL